MLTPIPITYAAYPCPPTHPFAFSDGKYCCKYQEDGDGNTISYSSESCKQNASGMNHSTACPKTTCRNNYGMC